LNPYFIVNADGIFEPFGMYVNWADSDIPAMPETRDETVTIPGQDGEIPTQITYAPLLFDFVLRTKDGLTVQQKEDLKSLIKAKLNPTRTKDVELLDIKTRKTHYVRLCGKFDVIEEHPDWFECRVPLKAYDPYGYEAYNKKFRGTINLKNTGNEFAHTTIEIVGRVDSPSFTANGEYYKYTGIVADNERLVIDSLSQTAYIITPTGERNVLANWCGKFLTLPVGITRILADFNVKIQYKERWI
jgi:hypothetical protein